MNYNWGIHGPKMSKQKGNTDSLRDFNGFQVSPRASFGRKASHYVGCKEHIWSGGHTLPSPKLKSRRLPKKYCMEICEQNLPKLWSHISSSWKYALHISQ